MFQSRAKKPPRITLMKTSFRLLLTCSLAVATYSPLRAQNTSNHAAEIARNLTTFGEIYKMLDTYYVDSLSADTVIEWAIHSMLSHVDPFTTYYPEDDEELRQMASGKYAGIGSVIRNSKKENRAVVSEPYEGTPSQTAGIKAGDVILTVDGEDIEGWPLEDVTQKLRGEAGTQVTVKVQRPGTAAPLTFTLTRKTIQLPAIPYHAMLNDSVGYILLTSFTSGATQETRRAFADLKEQGMRRLMLDLRDNPGGSLEEAVSIVSLFVPKGRKVVYTKGKMPSTNREYYTTAEPLDTLMPMAILVDGNTASAAEILSGSLQDMDRAVVVGSKTFGKGLVQSIHDLTYNGNLKITISRYHIPSGRCIQAYDYRHTNADGTISAVDDSLAGEFKTTAGRIVRGGGGITPDLTVEPDSLPGFVYDLAASEELFDYATQYTLSHPAIDPPGIFTLNDDEYEDFVAYIQNSTFKANRRSEMVLSLLKEAAQVESCYDDALEEFQALEAKLTRDISEDIRRQKAGILPYLNTEIVSRYYYQQGTSRQQLASDKAYDEALRLLCDDQQYHQTLRP